MRESLSLATGRRAVWLVAGALWVAAPAQAQRQARPRHYDDLVWKQPYYRGPVKLNWSVGRTAYFGDLSQGLRGNVSHWSAGLGASATVWPNLDVAAEVQYIQLAAVDQVLERGYTFRTHVVELTVVGRYFIEKYHFDPAQDSREGAKTKWYRPFAVLGVGGAMWWPEVHGGPDALAPGAANNNGERTYPAYTAVVPIGGGVALRVSPQLWVLPELSYRFTFTDDLDDVGARRGGGRNDGYAQLALRFQYAFPPSHGKRLH